MGYSLSLSLPGLPKTINKIGRSHWAVKAKEAKIWRSAVAWSAAGKRPPKPLTKARIIFTRCSQVPPDHDNLAISFKNVADGLIDAGIIKDDNYATIGSPTYKWEKAPRGHGFIKIQVYEAT